MPLNVCKYTRAQKKPLLGGLDKSNITLVKEHIYCSPYCFLEQETLPLLLSTGWFQERIRA